ncbi:zinc-dependent metalloprotease [Pleionea sp. CnH1-48]|uniref:zinc-dependent metalloprotease n=1 Tax=Pleionea sp. CnH1-48 TaxID=2954494 RepID=UPI00209738C3|nr:zinc-dependent metalloprotease [Pleionea sp. CnH1-48]MCO7225676.1 zinc-dependent metalloprotease [Pleionea sp. CnH1-48]
MKRAWIYLGLLLLAVSCVDAKSLKKATQGMQKKEGFFDVYYHQKQAKVYLLVDLEQDFIYVNGLPYGLGSNDIGLDRGRLGEPRIVNFRRVGPRVFLVQKNMQYRADSSNASEVRSVTEAFAESTLAGFDLVAESGDKALIDVTAFLLSDLAGVSRQLSRREQGRFSVDSGRSALDPNVLKSFPDNTELQSILTFTGNNPGQYVRQVAPDPYSFSLRQRVSFIRLPDDNYQRRVYHPRSGFWTHDYKNYAAPLTQSQTVKLIQRHRLEKKFPDQAKSEAIKPIVYYVDNGVPEPVRSALVEGALWWNQAFEAAGFDNAFQVKILPEDADPLDVRYNVIQWVHRATRGWSYGASIADPRSGEIIKGHVTLGSLRVRQDLLIAQGLTAPFAESNPAQSQQLQMALNRIKQLSAHEVGHTLGIAHNFAASADGRQSVMDYPHPLYEIKDDAIQLTNAYATGMGEWDKLVVKYGYSEFASGTDEEQALLAIIKEAETKQLHFISDPDARPQGGLHAEAHLWDNGRDPVQELERLMTVRQLALSQFNQNVIPDGTPFSQIEEVLVPIYNLHRYQVEAAVKQVAGHHYQYAVKGQDTFIQHPVEAKQQAAAIEALLKTLQPDVLLLPSSLIDLIPPKAYGYEKTRESFKGATGLLFDPLSAAEASAEHTLSLLLNAKRLSRLSQQHARNDEYPSLSVLLNQLSSQLIKSKAADEPQQQIQMRIAVRYLTHLLALIQNNQAPIEVSSAATKEVFQNRKWLKRKIDRARSSDEMLGYYLVLQSMLDTQHAEIPYPMKARPLPPGSPIGN